MKGWVMSKGWAEGEKKDMDEGHGLGSLRCHLEVR